MRIIYPHPMAFPNKMAHAIQVIHSCWELASRGVAVHLLVTKIERNSIKECLAVYGLPENENLNIIGSKKRSRRMGYYLSVLKTLWPYRDDKDTVLFLRDKNLARLLVLLKRLIRIPCVFESHALTYWVYQDKFTREHVRHAAAAWLRHKLRVRKYYRLEKTIYEKADGIVCQTAGIEQAIRGEFGISAPTTVIYSGTGVTANQVRRHGSDILYLGQLYPVKGTDVLIESLQFLPGRKLIIIGGNKEKDVARTRELCRRFNVSDRVVLTGYVEPREIEKYLDTIGVGVIPILDVLETRLFTSPLKLFDYMAAGIPIVASDLPSMREILSDRETAVLVEPNNPRKLAEGIERVLADKNLAEKISRQAYQKALDFSWGKRAENLIAFLNRIGGHA